MTTKTKLEKLLIKSSRLSDKNHTMTEFFNNSAMAKLLDIFLNNPNLQISLLDVLDATGLSRKSIWINMPKLIENKIVVEEQEKWYKFYKLNTESEQVKQIGKWRDTLTIL